MRLASFITKNKSLILDAWSAFFNAKYPDVAIKETHSRHSSQRERILAFITKDIASDQTSWQQKEKSVGRKNTPSNPSAGKIHGSNRIDSGLGIIGIIAEYRALRASVIDLWMATTPYLNTAEVKDLIRFNEAIDQAQTDSVESYAIGRENPSKLVESIMNSISEQAYLVDLGGKFTYVNQAVVHMHSMTLEKIIGTDFFGLNFAVAQTMQELIQKVIDNKEQLSGEVSHRMNGCESIYEYHYMPVLNEWGNMEAVSILARDITERKLTEDEYWHNANYDYLTELPNRRMFLDKLAEEIKLFRRFPLSFALLFIDLDGFKAINDAFGHDFGDELLRQVASRIDGCVRETDLLARLGGDEFTVILRNVNDQETAGIISKKIIHRLNSPFQIFEARIHISASLGITHFPKDAQTLESLLNNADKAMYAAKKAGRNQYLLFDSVDVK